MENDTTQFQVQEGIIEITLSGEKLPQSTTSLDIINRYGNHLFDSNKEFIREKVPDNWFIVIEPQSATLIASPNQIKLYEYTSEKFHDKLMYVIGLLKNNPVNYLVYA